MVELLGPKTQARLGLLDLEISRLNLYPISMKIYIRLLCLSLFFVTTPLAALAQVREISPALLTAIRQGQGIVTLSNTTRQAINPAKFTQLSASYRNYVQTNLPKLTAAKQNLSALQATVQSVDLSAPLDMRVKQAFAKQESLQQAQRQLENTLYRWGQLQDEADALGYTQLTDLLEKDNIVCLAVNGKTAFIQTTPDKNFVTISPVEILFNAQAVESLVKAHSLAAENLMQDQPEQMAGWFYLKTNFRSSLEQFHAANDAYTHLTTAHTGFLSDWRTYHSLQTPTGQLVTRNYNYAGADLALHTAKLLQFMSAHSESFPYAITSYNHIMQLNNQNFGIAPTFQNFWNASPILAF